MTFAGGTTVTVQDKGAMNVAGFAEFGTGSDTFSGGSKLTATAADISADDETSAPALFTLKGAGTAATIQDELDVGGDGDAGTLTVDGGASLTVAGDLDIGEGAAVNLTGAGSMLERRGKSRHRFRKLQH